MPNKLGIIAGGGGLPTEVIERCIAQNRPFFVLGLEGYADADLLAHLPHKMVRLGAVGDALKTLKKAEAEEVVMVGHVGRPTLSSLRPDMTATLLLAKLGSQIFSGDDALLGAIVKIMEGEGFAVVGVADVCPELLAQEGVLGKIRPTSKQQEDITRGMQALSQLGALDIGQAVIVEHGYVLGVEAAEGTEALIARCGGLRQHERGHGILVKCKKPTQDMRADLPTIGIETIEQIHAAGFVGIAIEAGSCIILNRDAVLERANQYKMFIVGTTHAP